MKHYDAPAYDKTKDETIDVCLNCTKEHCNGNCTIKDMKKIQDKSPKNK